MKTILTFLICLLTVALRGAQPPLQHNRMTTNTDSSVFMGTVATNESTLQFGFTGTMLRPFLAASVPALSTAVVSTNGENNLTTQRGVWVNTLAYSDATAATVDTNTGPLTITFSNLVGIAAGGLHQISGVSSLRSISYPALVFCGAAFNLLNLNQLTNLDAPLLTYCASSFNPGNTMNSLTSFSFPSLVDVVGQVAPTTYPACTNFSMPLLRTCASFQPSTFAVLTNLSLPSLQYVASTFGPTTMATLTNLSFPVLTNAGAFVPSTMAALTSLSFPTLEAVNSNFAPTTMAALTNWSFPKLRLLGNTFAPTTMAALGTLDCPSLTNVASTVSVASMAALTNVSFAAMQNYGSTITMNSSLGNLTTVTLGTVGTLKAISGATVNISGQKLTAASVNAILALLVSLDGTGGTTLWGAGKTLTINGGTSAAPSGQGATDKTTLQGRGATITTN